MLKKNLLLAAALGALVIGTPPAFAQGPLRVIEETEQAVPIEQVPEAAIEAAKGALEAEPTEAALVTLKDGEQVYELEATKDGEEVAVYVTPEGDILETDRGEDERTEARAQTGGQATAASGTEVTGVVTSADEQTHEIVIDGQTYVMPEEGGGAALMPEEGHEVTLFYREEGGRKVITRIGQPRQ